MIVLRKQRIQKTWVPRYSSIDVTSPPPPPFLFLSLIKIGSTFSWRKSTFSNHSLSPVLEVDLVDPVGIEVNLFLIWGVSMSCTYSRGTELHLNDWFKDSCWWGEWDRVLLEELQCVSFNDTQKIYIWELPDLLSILNEVSSVGWFPMQCKFIQSTCCARWLPPLIAIQKRTFLLPLFQLRRASFFVQNTLINWCSIAILQTLETLLALGMGKGLKSQVGRRRE